MIIREYICDVWFLFQTTYTFPCVTSALPGSEYALSELSHRPNAGSQYSIYVSSHDVSGR